MTRPRTRPAKQGIPHRPHRVAARRGETEGHGEPITLQRAQRIHAMFVRDAQEECARYDALWHQLSPMEQGLDRATARLRTVGTRPTIFELWADAHERLARFLAMEPGHSVRDALPPALLDILPLDAGLRQEAAAEAPWIMRGWAYDPGVQGLRPMDGFWVSDVSAMAWAARQWPGTPSDPLPIYTEDQAVRAALAARHIPLGARLTTIFDPTPA